MKFTRLKGFAREWKHLRLNEADFAALELMLEKAPDAGDVMSGTGGLRKVRFAAPSRHSGKSGAFRFGYVYFRVAEQILLVTVFAKNQKENLTAAEKARFKAFLETFKPSL